MFLPQIEWETIINVDMVLWEVWRSAVFKKKGRGGACSTSIEQEYDGDRFGDGGVVGRSAVVVLLGW